MICFNSTPWSSKCTIYHLNNINTVRLVSFWGLMILRCLMIVSRLCNFIPHVMIFILCLLWLCHYVSLNMRNFGDIVSHFESVIRSSKGYLLKITLASWNRKMLSFVLKIAPCIYIHVYTYVCIIPSYIHLMEFYIKFNPKFIYIYTTVFFLWYSPRQRSSWGQHGPTWVLSAPDGPDVGPMNLAIRGAIFINKME